MALSRTEKLSDDYLRLHSDGFRALNPEITAMWAKEILRLRAALAGVTYVLPSGSTEVENND